VTAPAAPDPRAKAAASGFFPPPQKKFNFFIDTASAFLAKRRLGKVFAKGYAKMNGRK
jgi:hypothetical protein